MLLWVLDRQNRVNMSKFKNIINIIFKPLKQKNEIVVIKSRTDHQ